MNTSVADVIHAGSVMLPADLVVPDQARGIVVFAHGSGSSRLSTRNQAVAASLRSGQAFGTLLFDLLTPDEDRTYANRFEIDLLTHRLLSAVEWLSTGPGTEGLPVGLFGASTGAAAALAAAASLGERVKAVVSRGGRPDLAPTALSLVTAPTLLIVGGHDESVIDLNRRALAELGASMKSLEIVPGATHLFDEPGTLEEVVMLTREWFQMHLR